MFEKPEQALQHLKQHVENYQGYKETTTRPESDENIRLFLIRKIRNLVEQLGQHYTARTPEDQERLNSLLKSTRRKLVTIHQSLKTPTYVDEPFFRSATIPEYRLSRIYALEGNMLEETDSIRMELVELSNDEKDRAAVEDHFLHIDAYVDNMNQALFEREALILGDE